MSANHRTPEEHRIYMREWRKRNPAKSTAKHGLRPEVSAKARAAALKRWKKAMPI